MPVNFHFHFSTGNGRDDAVVMEMVEAIIDNNNNENKSSDGTKLKRQRESSRNAQQQTSELNEVELKEEEIAREFSRLEGKKIQIYSVSQLQSNKSCKFTRNSSA